MDPETTAQTIRQTRGPTFAVLVMMTALGRPTGLKELVECTGYGGHAVHDALEQLARLGWAVRRRRYQGWELTAAGLAALSPDVRSGHGGELHQAPLVAPRPEGMAGGSEGHDARLASRGEVGQPSVPPAAPSAPEPVEMPVAADEVRATQGEWLPVPLVQEEQPVAEGGRGEGVLVSRRKARKRTRPRRRSPHPPGPPPPEGSLQEGARRQGAGPLDADAEAAVAALRALGCPRHTAGGKGAQDAVAAALAGGWSGAEVLAAVEGWRAYAQSQRGQGLVHAGFFVAARVRTLERPPEAAPGGRDPTARATERDAAARAYIAAAYERIVVH